MRKGLPISPLINQDRAENLKHSSRTYRPLDVFNDDLDAMVASWEDFYRGGTGRWYDTQRRDISDLDEQAERLTHDDSMREAHDDAVNDMKEDNDGTDHEAGDDQRLLD